ncbi:MAG: hypothetical protein CVU89_03300 [Firmicutes bacterium HGW-Firmicutes-14]|nr:MAG: hypothetical protein CVU89_03300 [Firmicutes bacterium HGW-Firmicutes-14]
MELINENELSEFIRELVTEASSIVSPGKVQICKDNLPFDSDVQTVIEGNGDYTLHVKPESIKNEYIISHEILHLCARKHVPSFIRVIEPNFAGLIGTELQGYLEHNWILAEQKRRGLAVDEQGLYSDIEETIGSDEEELEKNINRILTLNNLIHTHPAVYEEHQDFFMKNNPKSLEMAQRIMSHYPRQELYSNYEARKATIRAIKEWNNIFRENGITTVNLNILLSVIPVFSTAQLKRNAGVVLGLMPNAIINQKKRTASHLLYTMNDGQCCIIFSMDQNGLKSLKNYLDTMTLEEFLELAQIPCLLR